MTNDATMDITRCAEVAAHLAHFPPANHAEVVARFGLRWRDWEAAAAYWAKVRDAELAAGKTQLSSRFVHAFVTTAERLKERQVSMESIGPLPFSFRLEATPQAGPEPGDALASAPVVEATQVLAGARDLDAPSFRDPAGAADPASDIRYRDDAEPVSGTGPEPGTKPVSGTRPAAASAPTAEDEEPPEPEPEPFRSRSSAPRGPAEPPKLDARTAALQPPGQRASPTRKSAPPAPLCTGPPPKS
jgi:hypothetical protein